MNTTRLERFFRELTARVDATVTRAVVRLVNDKLRTQRLQLTLLADEPADDVEHFQPYGLSFVPPVGAEAIALAPAGYRAGTIAICVQAPGARPQDGKPHTGGLYTAGSWRVFVDEDGHVHLAAETGAAKLARADRVETELNKLWQALMKNAVHGSPMAPPGSTAGSVGADKVHGT